MTKYREEVSRVLKKEKRCTKPCDERMSRRGAGWTGRRRLSLTRGEA